MPFSFGDALGQAESWCEASGTGLQKDAGYKSNSCDLPSIDIQQSHANKHCQILQFPQEAHSFFQKPSFKDSLLPQVVLETKACSNSNRQLSSFQEGSSLISAVSGAEVPVLCVVTAGM